MTPTQHDPCVCVHDEPRSSRGGKDTNPQTAGLRRVCNLTHAITDFLSLSPTLHTTTVRLQFVLLHGVEAWLYYSLLDNVCSVCGVGGR